MTITSMLGMVASVSAVAGIFTFGIAAFGSCAYGILHGMR